MCHVLTNEVVTFQSKGKYKKHFHVITVKLKAFWGETIKKIIKRAPCYNILDCGIQFSFLSLK